MRSIFPLVLALAAPLSAQGLEEALAASDDLASAGNPAAAREALIDALAGAEDRGEILARLSEIEQRLGDWAFAAEVSAPGPAELLRGQVKSFKDKGLKVRMIYDWEDFSAADRRQDFLQIGDRWFFRVPLTGDAKLVLRGTWPADAENFALLLGFDDSGENGWRFTPGFKRTKIKPVVTLPRRLERIGSPFEVFHTDTEKLDEPVGDWAFTVELRRGSFTFKRGNKKIGAWKTAYPDLTAGLLGFSGPGIETIDFTGQLDPDAWANRRLEVLARKREEFLRSGYDVSQDLPAWFQEMKSASASRPAGRPPEGAPEAAREAWSELQDPNQALDVADWAQRHGGLEPAALAYAAAVRHQALGEWRACEQQVAQAKKAGMTDFGPLHALEWQARFHSGSRQKSTEELRKLLPSWPDDVGYPLARMVGRSHGPTAMLEVLDQAVAAGGLSSRIAASRRVLQTAKAYAREDGVHQYSGRNLHLISDGDPGFADEIGASAVAATGFITRYWGQIRQPMEPLFVLHFRDQEGRRAFCQRAGIAEDSEGYLSEYRFSLVVVDPDRGDSGAPEALFQALWPQMLDSTLDIERAPLWFVHGFAGIMGGCYTVGSGVELRVNVGLVAQEAENEEGWFFSPRQLVILPPGEWDKHTHWAVPESYLLLRYLWSHADRPLQDKFRAYADALFEGRTRAEAYQLLFGDVDLVELGRTLAAYRQGEIDNL